MFDHANQIPLPDDYFDKVPALEKGDILRAYRDSRDMYNFGLKIKVIRAKIEIWNSGPGWILNIEIASIVLSLIVRFSGFKGEDIICDADDVQIRLI